MCPQRSYCVDIFCWFLAVSLIHYTDMCGLIYHQPPSTWNNLSQSCRISHMPRTIPEIWKITRNIVHVFQWMSIGFACKRSCVKSIILHQAFVESLRNYQGMYLMNCVHTYSFLLYFKMCAHGRCWLQSLKVPWGK